MQRMVSSIRSTLFVYSFRLDGVDYEAELIAQRLVSVGHADLSHVGSPDIVPFGSIFQIICSQEVLLFLQTNTPGLGPFGVSETREKQGEGAPPNLVRQPALQHAVPSYLTHVTGAELPQLRCNGVLFHQRFLKITQNLSTQTLTGSLVCFFLFFETPCLVLLCCL